MAFEDSREGRDFLLTQVKVPASFALQREDIKNVYLEPWLVWPSGLHASLQTKRLRLQYLVRAHAWVASQAPSWGHARGN